MMLPQGNGGPDGDEVSPREELGCSNHAGNMGPPCSPTASRHWYSSVWAAGPSTFSVLAKRREPLVAGEQG